MPFFDAPLDASPLRKYALGAHLVLAAWLGINGVAHQVQVLWKARAGTLRAPDDLSGLLGVGAGLLLGAALVSWSIAPLARTPVSAWPAVGSIAVVGGVVAAIAARYGMRFLGGTILVSLVDLVLIALFAFGQK